MEVFKKCCVAAMILLAVSVFSYFRVSAQPTFNRGVNLTQWFQTNGPKQIHFTKFTKRDFENIKGLGCDVIRLPINLHAMTNGAPDFTLDPTFLFFLDQVVGWSEELNLYLIIDNHSFDPSVNTDPAIENILTKVWAQLAFRYKDRSDFILYEVLNEPHGISDAVWSEIQQSVIDAIRASDTKHYIVVGGSNYNSYLSLANLPVYSDSKLIYTFHFYDPFLFTHQGASWVGPSLVSLTDIPFPYKASSMPGLPSEFNGTWIQSAYNNYATEGTVTRVKQLLDVAIDFKTSRNVPVFCGEFGVYIPNSDDNERVKWYEEVSTYLNQNEIPWTVWDYTGGFGLFEKGSQELFDYDLNVPLLTALDFEIPPQQEFVQSPVRAGLTIYDDFIGEGIVSSVFTNAGTVDYYSSSNPYRGVFATYWADVNQYDAIGFDFIPNLDFSLLPGNDFSISFWVRGNSPSVSFDIRFVDTKENALDRPWRMGKTIDNAVVVWDGEWQQVTIPLQEFEENGAWDNGWFNPEGKFDWSAIDRFEIVAEHHSLVGIEISFDDIQLVGEEIIQVVDTESDHVSALFKIYPNPVRGSATIEFSDLKPTSTYLAIYNQQGQQIRTWSPPALPTNAENNSITWDGLDAQGERVAPGLYCVFIRLEEKLYIRKIVVIND